MTAPAVPAPASIRGRAADAARVVAFGFGSDHALREPTDVEPLYTWGWLPLVAGCVVLVVATVVLSDVVLTHLGLAEPNRALRLVFTVRAVLTSTVLAAWAGWYVLRTRRRIEAAREALLARRRELEVEAARAEQAAGLGAFSRILAHEVRNPLNAIVIHCALLERRAMESDGAGKPLRDIIDVLRAETTRLEHLVDDYIAYGRAHQVEVHPVPTHLEALVRGVVDARERALRAKDLSLAIDAPADLPPVSADGERTAHAVLHLLCRARESSPRGGRIAVELRDEGPCVSLTIRDDGPPFADPGAVFRPFFTGGDPATGFGLAIARDIVRAHGGEVQAGNDPRGKPFVVLRLPKAAR